MTERPSIGMMRKRKNASLPNIPEPQQVFDGSTGKAEPAKINDEVLEGMRATIRPNMIQKLKLDALLEINSLQFIPELLDDMIEESIKKLTIEERIKYEEFLATKKLAQIKKLERQQQKSAEKKSRK